MPPQLPPCTGRLLEPRSDRLAVTTPSGTNLRLVFGSHSHPRRPECDPDRMFEFVCASARASLSGARRCLPVCAWCSCRSSPTCQRHLGRAHGRGTMNVNDTTVTMPHSIRYTIIKSMWIRHAARLAAPPTVHIQCASPRHALVRPHQISRLVVKACLAEHHSNSNGIQRRDKHNVEVNHNNC